jgi:hypothetical protein
MGDQAVSMKVRPRQEIKSVDNKIAPMLQCLAVSVHQQSSHYCCGCFYLKLRINNYLWHAESGDHYHFQSSIKI